MAKPEKLKNNSIKLTLLGHGPFAEPAFTALKQNYSIVELNDADCLIVANYGKILSAEELVRPKFGALNLHGSLLPAYRGASPVQIAILNNEARSGVTIIKMDEKIDHGPILGQKQVEVSPLDTTPELMVKLGRCAKDLIEEILPKYLSGKLKPVPQDESKATFTRKIKLEDARILDSDSDQIKHNKVRAFADEPGVFYKLPSGEDLKILSSGLINGRFVPKIVQKPGKKPQSFSDFLNGYRGVDPFSNITD